MGIFKRPDSPSWWIFLEGSRRRISTNIRINGRAEKREAQERYLALMLEQAEDDTDAILIRAIVLLQRRQARRAHLAPPAPVVPTYLSGPLRQQFLDGSPPHRAPATPRAQTARRTPPPK